MADIHKYITDFFKKWFAGEDIDTEGMHSDDVDWQKLLTNREYYNQQRQTTPTRNHMESHSENASTFLYKNVIKVTVMYKGVTS